MPNGFFTLIYPTVNHKMHFFFPFFRSLVCFSPVNVLQSFSNCNFLCTCLLYMYLCVCVCGSDSFNPMVAMALWRNRQKCVCAHFNMIMLFLFNYLSETQLSTIFFPSICCRIDVVVVVVVLCVISEIPIRLAQYHRFRILNRASIVITSSVSIYVSSDSSIDGW